MTQQRQWAFGVCRARFEEPDLLLLHYGGLTGLEDARRTIELYREVGTERPFFALIDIARASLTPEAWDCLAREGRPEWFRGIIFIRAGVVQKAVTKALGLALQAVGKWTLSFHFVDTEEAARALADTLRAPHSAPGTR